MGRGTSSRKGGKGDKGSKGEKGQVVPYGKGKGLLAQASGAPTTTSNYVFYGCPVNLYAV